MAITNNYRFSFIIIVIFNAIPISLCQTKAPSPAADSSNGIFLSYAHIKTTQIPPDLTKSDPTHQPYRFESTLTVLNNGLQELKSWKVFVGFTGEKLLVTASNAVLADGSILPASVGNGTVFSGYPMTDLKTTVETAGDLTQMQVQVNLLGTQYGRIRTKTFIFIAVAVARISPSPVSLSVSWYSQNSSPLLYIFSNMRRSPDLQFQFCFSVPPSPNLPFSNM